MSDLSTLIQDIARRQKWIEDKEILIDVLERDGGDTIKEQARLEEERDLFRSQLLRLQHQQNAWRPSDQSR